jgi:hypothetical protein
MREEERGLFVGMEANTEFETSPQGKHNSAWRFLKISELPHEMASQVLIPALDAATKFAAANKTQNRTHSLSYVTEIDQKPRGLYPR